VRIQNQEYAYEWKLKYLVFVGIQNQEYAFEYRRIQDQEESIWIEIRTAHTSLSK
jgi:hypothetical protein